MMNNFNTFTEQNMSDQRRNKKDIEDSSQQLTEYTHISRSSPYYRRPELNHKIDNIAPPIQNINAQSSSQNIQFPVANVKFVPIKKKDLVKILKNDELYNGQYQTIEKNNSPTEQISMQQALYQTPMTSPIHTKKHLKSKPSPQLQMTDKNLKQTINRNKVKRSFVKPNNHVPRYYRDLDSKNQQVFAMPDVEAFPALGECGFRAHPKSKQKFKKRSRRSRTLIRSESRPRSKQQLRSKPRYVKCKHRMRSPVVTRKKTQGHTHLHDFPCCTPYPLCDNECRFSSPNHETNYIACNARPHSHKVSRYQMRKPKYRTKFEPEYPERRSPLIMSDYESDDDRVCSCVSREHVKLIQPGLCSKKGMWTNEYAIIPRPKITLIDPCKEFDPLIHPRANEPCIRDNRGNPLTDCIGRPLRDPTGRKFLRFNANGSIMETNVRGNFYTGQPPLCVKQPFPECSCAHDTTHNWWLSSGHPILPDMSMYFKQLLECENKLH